MRKSSNRLVEIFLQIVAINAISGNEKPIAQYIRTFLEKLDLDVTEDGAGELSGGNSGNIICQIGTGGNTALIAHMDTVRPTDQLVPRILSDRIISSGDTILGADNRIGVALILHTIEKAVTTKNSFAHFTAVFTVCEESSMAGSKFIELPGTITGAYAIDSLLRPGNFVSSTYGSKVFKINVVGKGSHSGLAPEQGINSIQIAALAINTLQSGRINQDLIVNIATINGGEAVNVVPAKTVIEGEIRARNKSQANAAFQEIETKFIAAAEKYSGRVEFEHSWAFLPYTIDSNHPIFQRLVNAINESELIPIPHLSPGGSDANTLNEKGIPTINIGIGAQKPHSNEEFVLLEDIEAGSRIIANLVLIGN